MVASTVGRKPRTVIVSQSLMSTRRPNGAQSIVNIGLTWLAQRAVFVRSRSPLTRTRRCGVLTFYHGSDARCIGAVRAERVAAGRN